METHTRPSRPGVAPSEHLRRLVLLLGAGLIAAAFVRTQLVPETFGRDGHYRAAAIDEIVAKEPTFMGSATCAECHAERAAEHAKGKHKDVACETCHGAAKGHLTRAQTRAKLVIDTSQVLCLRCHLKIAGRPAGFPQIDVAQHREKRGFEPDAKCSECHGHTPEE